jgi:threonine synthase
MRARVLSILRYATPLLRLSASRKLLGLDHLEVYVKWEGGNPTGTHKDRAALAHISRAVSERATTVTVGTCGNYGVAIAYYALLAGLRAVIFVPRSYESSRVEEMRRYGAKVVLVDGTYEDAVEASARAAALKGWYDANPGSGRDSTSFQAYSRIAREIVAELGDAPYAVSVPVGNGTTMVGLYLGFLEAYKEGYATRIPRFIAASTSHANQVVESWLQGRLTPVEVPPGKVKETPVNEPLVAYRSLNAEEALRVLYETKGRAYAFSDEELVETSLLLQAVEGVSSLPASSSALLALREFAREEAPEGPLVAVITGRWLRRH